MRTWLKGVPVLLVAGLAAWGMVGFLAPTASRLAPASPPSAGGPSGAARLRESLARERNELPLPAPRIERLAEAVSLRSQDEGAGAGGSDGGAMSDARRRSHGLGHVTACLVRGRLVGATPRCPPTTPVFVLPHLGSPTGSPAVARFDRFDEKERPPHATVQFDGSFEVDLAPLFDAVMDEWPAVVDVVFNDPFYLPQVQTIGLPQRTDERTLVLTTEIPAQLVGVLVGTVRGLEPGSSALVGLFPLSGGLPAARPVAVDVLDAGGGFWLRSPDAGTFLVVAAADGQTPVAELFEMSVGSLFELAPILLGPAVTVSGTVEVSPLDVNAAEQPPFDVDVVADLLAPGAIALELGPQPVAWDQGRVLPRSRVTTCRLVAGHGEFTLAGLVDGRRHRVHVAGSDALFAAGSSQWCSTIVVPAREVRLAVHAACIHLDVHCGLAPVADAAITLMPDDAVVARTGAEGRAGFFVPAERPCELLITASGMKPGHATVVAGRPGMLERASVELERELLGATLLLDLSCEGLAFVQWAKLRFEAVAPGDVPNAARIAAAVTETRSAVPFMESRGVAAFTREVLLRKGQYRLEGLPEGRWRVEAELLTGVPPGDSWALETVPRRKLLPAPLEVELPKEGQVRIRMRVRRGAILACFAQDVAGKGLAARCVIHDERGVRIEPSFSVLAASWHGTRAGWLEGSVPCDTDPALPPGMYSVEFSFPGCYSESVDVEVRAGECKEVKVTLTRRP